MSPALRSLPHAHPARLALLCIVSSPPLSAAAAKGEHRSLALTMLLLRLEAATLPAAPLALLLCASSEPSRRTLSPRHPRSMLVVAAAPRLVRRHARCNLNAAAGPRSPAASMAAFAAALQAGAPERKLGAAVADKRLSASVRVHPRPRQSRRRCRACLCTAALPRWRLRARTSPPPSLIGAPPALCCSTLPVPPPTPLPAWLWTPSLEAPSQLVHSSASCSAMPPPAR